MSDFSTYRKDLGNGLVMKTVQCLEDLNGVISLLKIVFQEEPSVARLYKTLYYHYPLNNSDYFLFVEDERLKKVVATITLIHFSWQFGNINIKTAEMGIVGTLEEYRNKGLIRELNARFEELLDRDEYDITVIEGIPYFYKQFGYEYAMPLEPWNQLDLTHLPDREPDSKKEFNFLRASKEDIPLLSKLYSEAVKDLDIKSIRNEAIWQYLLDPSLEYDPSSEFWLIVDPNEEKIGYFRVSQEGFGEGLILKEVSNVSFKAAIEITYKLKELALKCKKSYVRLNVHDKCVLLDVAKSVGLYNPDQYAWQIKIPNLERFLKKIKPIIDKRLENGPFQDLSDDFYINLYQNALKMTIKKGKIKEIKIIPSTDKSSNMSIPPNLLIPLVFGYRSREELEKYNHDFTCDKQWGLFVDILLPKLNSFIYSIF